jgi:hypothetical protein
MDRAVLSLLALTFVAITYAGLGPARAQEAGCEGSWLIEITLDGRDATETGLLAFDSDGSATLHGAPVLPALPGPGETPLLASDGLGAWQALEDGGCAFEVARVLGTDDGTSVGTLNVRGTAMMESGGVLAGSLETIRATAFGQTAAAAAGSLAGTSLSGPLLSVTPPAAGADN